MPRASPPAARPRRATAERVLDAAERLVQIRGFNGFSYADVSAEVGVTTASLHYHFPGKAALGRALVDRYGTAFEAALAGIAARHARAVDRLAGYAALYGDVLARGRMCLCGMLAAEYETLPAPVQQALRRFFDRNEAWLVGVLERGRDEGELTFPGSARDVARQWTAALEGALLLARPFGESSRLTAVARRLLDDLTRGPPATRRRARTRAARRA